MQTSIEEETNVRVFETELREAKKTIGREEMSELAGRTVRGALLVLFLIVLGLTVILFITRSFLTVEMLLAIGGISFLAALATLILKFSGFYRVLKISNPADIQATDIAAVFGLIGIFSCIVPTVYGVSSIPNFVLQVQNFMSNQQKIVEEMLKILQNLAP